MVSLSNPVPDSRVTADAGQRLYTRRISGVRIITGRPRHCLYRVDDLLMAVTTRILRDRPIVLFDLEEVGEISGRESERVPEPVRCLSSIFADKVMRGVAVVADGNCAMAAFNPGIVIVIHHMAICACGGVVRHVRIASGIDEGEYAYTYGEPGDNPESENAKLVRSHIKRREPARCHE